MRVLKLMNDIMNKNILNKQNNFKTNILKFNNNKLHYSEVLKISNSKVKYTEQYETKDIINK